MQNNMSHELEETGVFFFGSFEEGALASVSGSLVTIGCCLFSEGFGVRRCGEAGVCGLSVCVRDR